MNSFSSNWLRFWLPWVLLVNLALAVQAVFGDQSDLINSSVRDQVNVLSGISHLKFNDVIEFVDQVRDLVDRCVALLETTRKPT